ncbi:MAG TPA: glycosyltransferase family 39 protein [bacterium]|nr:glycosyltransferase family 39 protein [bacterium]
MTPFRRFLWIYVAVFLAYGVLRSHTLLSPILHDEGLFLAGAQACAAGELPYRDFWDHKPPGIFYFHSIPLRVFPFSRLAVKIHEIIWIALSASLFLLLCRRLFSSVTATVTLAFYVFYTSAPVTIRSGGLTEELALPWLVLAYFLIFAPPKRNGTSSESLPLPPGEGRGEGSGTTLLTSLLAGICLGMAGQFRQTFLLSAIVFLWIIWSESAPKTHLQHIGSFLLGLILPEMLVSLYFLLYGAWWVYFETSYLFNFAYIHGGNAPPVGRRTFEQLFQFLLNTGPYLAAPILAFGALGKSRFPARRFLVPLILLFALDLCSAELSGEDYEHYYVQAAVSSCLLIGLLVQAVETDLRNRQIPGIRLRLGRMVLVAILGVLTATAVYGYGRDVIRLVQMQKRERGPIVLQNAVADGVRRVTLPEDRILLLGKSPNSVYIVAHRLPGSRYYHNAPLFKAKLREFIPERFHEEFLSDLRTRRPVVLILGAAEGESITRGMDLVREQAPFMLDYLNENYVPLEQITDKIPDDWTWYGVFCRFLIRKDRMDDLVEAF